MSWTLLIQQTAHAQVVGQVDALLLELHVYVIVLGAISYQQCMSMTIIHYHPRRRLSLTGLD